MSNVRHVIIADGAPTSVAMEVTSLFGPRTGVAAMVDAMVSRLAVRSDIELTGVSVSWRGGRAEDVLPAGCSGQTFPLPARLSHALWRRFDRPRLAGFDVVHGPNYVVPPAGSAARLVTVHDLTAWRFPDLVDHHSRHYPDQLRRAVAGGAHVHTVSRHVAGEIIGELGIDEDRVHPIQNGFTPGPTGDSTAGRTLVGAPYVLAIGTIEPRKDYPTLVDAMMAVWEVHPDLKLAIVGGRGWDADRLDRRVDARGVTDRIVQFGYTSERVKANLLAGARLLAYPSVYEGFGFPILEAMDAGVPVVSTVAGAVPETAGRAAVLVEPRDVNALAGALLTVIEDDALRDDLATAGRRQVGRFSWDAAVQTLSELYRRLADERSLREGSRASRLLADRR